MLYRVCVILFFCLGLVVTSFGQNTADSILVKKTGGGVIFFHNGKKLRSNQVAKIISSQPRAVKEYGIAKTNATIGSIFGYAGGFCVGWSLGSAISGKPTWALTGVGAGLIGAGIPFSIASNRHAKKAVDAYNEALPHITTRERISLEVGFIGEGIGMRLRF